jgi:hypothetical protein
MRNRVQASIQPTALATRAVDRSLPQRGRPGIQVATELAREAIRPPFCNVVAREMQKQRLRQIILRCYEERAVQAGRSMGTSWPIEDLLDQTPRPQARRERGWGIQLGQDRDI